jgi:hypothetical protein
MLVPCLPCGNAGRWFPLWLPPNVSDTAVDALAKANTS